MFGEVKLGEADHTVVWETLLFMSHILCQISWKGPFEAQSLLNKQLLCVSLLENEKKTLTEISENEIANMIKPGTYVDKHV